MGARYSIEQISLFRNFFGLFPHLLVLLIASANVAEKPRWRIKRWKLGLARGLMLIAAQMCFYYAIVHMELATATTLAFCGPLFITVLSIPMLGHRVGLWRWFAVLLGFVGVVMVMRPGGEVFNPVALLPIGAAFFYATASLSSRFFQANESTALISIYSTATSLFASFILVLVTGSWVPMTTPGDWLLFVGMGTVGGVAVLLLITAYRMSEPSVLSPFEYFGIPFSFFLGWYFFAETPINTLFPGVLLIVGAGLLVIWRERINKKQIQ